MWGGLLLTPGSCPAPYGPAALFAPLLRRSGYFLLATQEKVTRSPEASEKRRGCHAPKARALHAQIHEQRHWAPACAGATSNGRRVKNRQGCRATKARALEVRIHAQSHWAQAFAGVTRCGERGKKPTSQTLSSRQMNNQPVRECPHSGTIQGSRRPSVDA